MKLEGHIYCDGPDCERHAHIGPDRFSRTGKLTSLPPGFVWLRDFGARTDGHWTFCGYDCLMKWAAHHPPEEIIECPPFPDEEQ